MNTFSLTAANEVGAGYNFLRNRALPQEVLVDSAVGIQRLTAADFPGLSTILLARKDGGATIG